MCQDFRREFGDEEARDEVSSLSIALVRFKNTAATGRWCFKFLLFEFLMAQVVSELVSTFRARLGMYPELRTCHGAMASCNRLHILNGSNLSGIEWSL